MKKHLLLFLATSIFTSIGWSQPVFNNSGGDNQYSNTANWSTGALPTTSQYAQFNTDATLDIDATIAQIRGTADATLSDGGGTITITGEGKPAVLMASADKTFVIDGKIISNIVGNLNYQFNQDGTLTFGPNSSLTLLNNARSNSIAGVSGNLIFNGALLGSGAFQFGLRTSIVFGASSNNSGYDGTLTYYSPDITVEANTADDGIFVPTGKKIQINNTGGTLKLNGKNIYQGNLTLGGSHTFRLEINANQLSMEHLVFSADGTLTLAIGDGVSDIHLNDNSSQAWNTGSFIVENFKNGVLRFGTDGNGLTSAQLSQFSIGGGTVYLDDHGYIIETGSPVYSSSWSVNPGASDNAVITGAYSAGDLEVNDLVVQSGGSLSIASGETIKINGDLINRGTINIASGGSLIIMGTSSGNATITRNTTGNDGYSIIGAPVSGATLDNLVSQGATHLYESDGTNFTPVTAGAMASGSGYFMAQVGNASPSVSFTGAMVSGDVTTSVSETGYTLLANPYAAAISVDQFLASDASNATTGSIYVWSDGGTNGVSETGKRDGTYLVSNQLTSQGIVGSVQGFFVQGQNGGEVTFTPGMQSTSGNGDASYYREATKEKQILELSISGNGLYHATVLGFVDGATLGRDYGLDAEYLKGNEFISFYSNMNDLKFATQGLPMAQNEMVEVNLGMDLAEAGMYSISVEKFSGFSNDVSVSLIDELTGKSYDLSEDFSMSFSSEAVIDATRFKVVAAPAAILDLDKPSDGIRVFGGQSGLTINYASNQLEHINIYAMDGRSVFSGRVNFYDNQASVPVQINRGQVYVLRVNDQSVKFIVE